MAPCHAPLRRAGHPLAEDAIALLLTSSFAPLYSRDALAFTLGFLDQVAKTVPCHELRFVPDEQVIALLRDSLGIER